MILYEIIYFCRYVCEINRFSRTTSHAIVIFERCLREIGEKSPCDSVDRKHGSHRCASLSAHPADIAFSRRYTEEIKYPRTRSERGAREGRGKTNKRDARLLYLVEKKSPPRGVPEPERSELSRRAETTHGRSLNPTDPRPRSVKPRKVTASGRKKSRGDKSCGRG